MAGASGGHKRLVPRADRGAEKRKEGVLPVEHRHGTLRRQFNESFCDPYGNLSWSKTVANFAQIACLYQFSVWFKEMIDQPTTLLIVLAFLIAPEIIKKALVMKLGGQTTTESSSSVSKSVTQTDRR